MKNAPINDTLALKVGDKVCIGKSLGKGPEFTEARVIRLSPTGVCTVETRLGNFKSAFNRQGDERGNRYGKWLASAD